MADKHKSRDDGAHDTDDELEDSDLADEDEGKDDEEGDEEQDEKKGKEKGAAKQSKVEETPDEVIARLKRELKQAQKGQGTIAVERDKYKGLLAKVLGEEETPEDAEAKVAERERKAEQRLAKFRESQKRDAVRDYIDEHHPEYAEFVEFLTPSMSLSDEDIVDDEYDPDALEAAAKRVVERFVKKKLKTASNDDDDDPGGGGGRKQGGGKKTVYETLSPEYRSDLDRMVLGAVPQGRG